VICCLSWICACADSQASSGAIEPNTATQLAEPNASSSLKDAALTDYQVELLEVAYRSASKFPLEPHLKNRSRAQEAVVSAAFELDAPNRALVYAEGIGNWRKGAGYADYACYMAEHGHPARVAKYIDLATQVAKTTEDWRRRRIYAKIARTHLLGGQRAQAEAIGEELAAGDAGPVQETRASLASPEEFETQLAWVNQAFTAGDLDQVRTALSICVQLHDRCFDDVERRDSIEAMVVASMQKAPLILGIGTLLDLARTCLSHQHRARAALLVARVEELIENVEWLPEDKIPVVARKAQVQFLAGAQEAARAALEQMRALFWTKREVIVDIFRADALLPLAEAYQGNGDTQSALVIYGLALEEAVVNSNSRPRVDDLVAICCSMATHGVRPPEALMKRIHAIETGLGAPW
jgi:hypothetical protein